MKTEYVLIGVVGALALIGGLQIYSMIELSNKLSDVASSSPTTQAAVKLPANIQSSAPMSFKSFEEEVEYYKKNAKNPNNIDIEKAVQNMDANLDGLCDSCGMAILHCIEQGMEDM